ncbi:MAG: tRNA uridine-5-carboxymethylaminomethyl(34) synthesis enzyme MnmG [Candidatus Omnitrophica bacterium]|nr:tRNA uridine-5-carboxymethylaminomethyl(34) synthesis enzyme MnmG [Candidatus Omnitrophota bacterium]
MKTTPFDIIVIGSGHAGTEAALATARMGCHTALITLRKDTIGVLSCNPAVGGIGKGQLVKEIDALGGEMAKATDYAGIQFRILNASRGAAVHSSRAQVDRTRYARYMQNSIKREKAVTVIEGMVVDLQVVNKKITGVKLASGEILSTRAVVLTPGTFLNGLIHIGLQSFPGGRIGEKAVSELSLCLKDLGVTLLRFKTGTCARLDKRTIDFSKLEPQYGDKKPIPFSITTKKVIKKQLPCYITYTNQKTHDIIRSGLDRSPLYSGVIKGTGVRYCPSIEDKIVRFSDRDRHQIFLEPEGVRCVEVYPNGISTSLPEDVQLTMIHSITGLERAEVIRFGYGIEHDVIEPTQLYPTLESKHIVNLYCAGQINGTTGYEEAGAQGLFAGINAALRVQGKEPLILDRSTSYLGVLIDDLVTKGTNEPYRMFTSRVEYRLVLREDNADRRLGKIGYDVGLLSTARYKALEEKNEKIKETMDRFRTMRIKPKNANDILEKHTIALLKASPTAEEFLRRPEVNCDLVKKIIPELSSIDTQVLRQVEIQIKYAGYIERQLRHIKQFKGLEKTNIPQEFNYHNMAGLSREIQEKLSKMRPVSLGQASRVSGVTPAAIMILMIHLKKYWAETKQKTEDGRQRTE